MANRARNCSPQLQNDVHFWNNHMKAIFLFIALITHFNPCFFRSPSPHINSSRRSYGRSMSRSRSRSISRSRSRSYGRDSRSHSRSPRHSRRRRRVSFVTIFQFLIIHFFPYFHQYTGWSQNSTPLVPGITPRTLKQIETGICNFLSSPRSQETTFGNS